MEDFGERLRKGKEESKEKSDKYFMKLSTRSPKDNCWDYRDEKERNMAVKNLVKYLHDKKELILSVKNEES